MKHVQPSQSSCCGCSACYSICPKKAIFMQEDQRGFLYPVINEAVCIDCGLCQAVCDFDKFRHNVPNEQIDCYASRHRAETEVSTSRSGGFFIALAEYVLHQEGVVFGAEFQDVKTVIHKAEYTKQGIDKFKGSKYVQSDMQDCFQECADYLTAGRWVLFSGTACQIHGLLSLLKLKRVSTERLIAVDIVCHGVPSRKLWRDYVRETENRHGKAVVSANFRNKELFGWREHKESFVFSDATNEAIKAWTNVFYAHIMFRESCYHCSYTTPHRYSDFSIADYWGIENNAPEFDDNKGVNLVLVHTEKGREIFEQIKGSIHYRKTNLETSMQPNLMHPSEKGALYEPFWRDYEKLSNTRFMEKYFFPSQYRLFADKVKRKLKRIYHRLVR